MESSMARSSCAGDSPTVEHDGMQVAVARVEDVGDAQASAAAMAAILSSTAGSAVRGMTPSCTM